MCPRRPTGRIEQPLSKRFGAIGERMAADEAGRPAVTDYRVVERAGRRAAWLALEPLTGRTHQLRAHCALIGTPILGDGKYGGAAAFLEGAGHRRAAAPARADDPLAPPGRRRGHRDRAAAAAHARDLAVFRLLRTPGGSRGGALGRARRKRHEPVAAPPAGDRLAERGVERSEAGAYIHPGDRIVGSIRRTS